MSDEKRTLDESSIVTERVGRRSAVAAISHTLLGGLVGAMVERLGQAQRDRDQGPDADPHPRPQRGDSDRGPNRDRPGR